MKRIAVLGALMLAICSQAQTSKVGRLNITAYKVGPASVTKVEKTVQPPIFEIVGDVVFSDPSGNGAIDAGESCTITMTVVNNGLGPGKGLKSHIVASGTSKGLQFIDLEVPDIAVGQKQTIVFPILAGTDTENGKVQIGVCLNEPNGFGTHMEYLEIETRAFQPPLVQVVDYIASSNMKFSKTKTLQRAKPFDLQLLIKNTALGKAEEVSLDVSVPENVTVLGIVSADGTPATPISGITLRPKETKDIIYSLIVTQYYKGDTIPIRVLLHEKYGKYAESRVVELALDQSMGEKRTIPAFEDEVPIFDDRTRLGSDVDRDIPQSRKVNENTFVLIMANSEYQNEKELPTALKDGYTMYEYCLRTLGVPDRNISYQKNLTKNQMEDRIDNFSEIMKAFPDGKFLVFYYGHGVTNPDGRDTFLIPVDGYSSKVARTCYRRSDMLKTLSFNPSRSTVVFMESCFSGATPDGDMLSYGQNSSGVLMEPREESIAGNVVVISASSGTQVANAYPQEQHNLFTYCLLKVLKESKGDISLGELFEKASSETKKVSLLDMERLQEPAVLVSPMVGNDWKKWTLK